MSTELYKAQVGRSSILIRFTVHSLRM